MGAPPTRVPGAASTEVDFELERFERAGAERIEVSGRWYGLRGRRFVRPVLHLHTGGGRRRVMALLEHKPWAADDGQTWTAAFAWPENADAVQGAELEVGPGLVAELPALGEPAGRVRALRSPIAPRRSPRYATPEPDELAGALPAEVLRPAPPRRDPARETQLLAERDGAFAARDVAERERLDALGERDDALSRRDAALRDVDRAGVEREEAVAERERLRTELDRVAHERDHAHAERNRTLRDAEAVQRERDQLAAERDAARAELARVIPSREQALQERDALSIRADRAESERDTAAAERKTAVAQRDRARRERDRAMRAAGLDSPDESAGIAGTAGSIVRRDSGAGGGDARRAGSGNGAGAVAAGDGRTAAGPAAGLGAVPGAGVPSRPVKRLGGATPHAPAEPKPLLIPVDGSRPRRLSRTRRPPSAPARWAVRIVVLALLLAIALVLVLLLSSRF